MKTVDRTDIVDIARYEKQRPEFRARVLAEKELRRVAVGPHFVFLFENQLTVLYQIQEMMRVERIVEEDAIAHEIRTYNELIPPPGQLGATLLIGFEDPQERDAQLRKLVGIENHVSLRAGDHPAVQGSFDRRQMNEQRVSSVQYVQFPLQQAHRQAWQEAGKRSQVRLVVNHPAYRHEAALEPRTIAALQQDLED